MAYGSYENGIELCAEILAPTSPDKRVFIVFKKRTWKYCVYESDADSKLYDRPRRPRGKVHLEKIILPKSGVEALAIWPPSCKINPGLIQWRVRDGITNLGMKLYCIVDYSPITL